jgi:hypothetical protein
MIMPLGLCSLSGVLKLNKGKYLEEALHLREDQSQYSGQNNKAHSVGPNGQPTLNLWPAQLWVEEVNILQC